MNRFVRALLLLLALALPAMAAAKAPSSEIERLLQRVEQQHGVVFIRNGSEHDAREAATHLRRKLAATHGRVTTPEQLIEVLGTRSSMTGTAYRVRLPDGREMDSATWLRHLLRGVRATPPAPPPAHREAQISSGTATG